MSLLPRPYQAGDILGNRYEVFGEINRERAGQQPWWAACQKRAASLRAPAA